MIKPDLIAEIISLYQKHGWNLRRVLLCLELKNSLSEKTLRELFGDGEVSEAEFNAVWFSRPSKRGQTAWELRHLSENPFALFELTPDDEPDEEILRRMENRLKEHTATIKRNQNS